MAGKKQLSNEIYDQIFILNESGKRNREIAKLLNINHRTVGDFLRKNGKQSSFANQPINQISDTEAICSRCNLLRSIKEFQFGRKGQKYEYRFSFCNKCRKKQNYLNLNNDVNKFLADRFRRMKRRSKNENIICSITKEEFIEQYYSQNGLCFYTNVKLICEVGSDLHRNSLSIDKIIPEQGYVKGNLVFTTHRINTCKSDLSIEEIKKWMPLWGEKIIVKTKYHYNWEYCNIRNRIDKYCDDVEKIYRGEKATEILVSSDELISNDMISETEVNRRFDQAYEELNKWEEKSSSILNENEIFEIKNNYKKEKEHQSKDFIATLKIIKEFCDKGLLDKANFQKFKSLKAFF